MEHGDIDEELVEQARQQTRHLQTISAILMFLAVLAVVVLLSVLVREFQAL